MQDASPLAEVSTSYGANLCPKPESDVPENVIREVKAKMSRRKGKMKLKYSWQRVEERWNRKRQMMKVRPSIQFPAMVQALKLRAQKEELAGIATAKRLLRELKR